MENNTKVSNLDLAIRHHDYEPHPDGGCKVCAYPRSDDIHSRPPQVGTQFKSERLGMVEIVRIHKFGTIDVRKVGTDKFFRISGLPLK